MLPGRRLWHTPTPGRCRKRCRGSARGPDDRFDTAAASPQASALQMLEDSLRRYQTDHLDLWQIHGIVYDNDPELAYAKGGVLEAFDRAKKEGKVRFVGFTGHKDPAFHLKMLE